MKKRKVTLLLCASLMFTGLYAEEQTAEQLVASKKKADMTYKQLMATMGGGSTMMHEGILRENKQMVKSGANLILHHPAPKHKPWSIMKKEDQADFKKSLLAYDKILDMHTESIITAADKKEWSDAATAANELMHSCISCHSIWKNNVK